MVIIYVVILGQIPLAIDPTIDPKADRQKQLHGVRQFAEC